IAAQTVAATFARRQKSAEARIAPIRLTQSVIPASTYRRTTTQQSEPFPRREKSSTNAQEKSLINPSSQVASTERPKCAWRSLSIHLSPITNHYFRRR